MFCGPFTQLNIIIDKTQDFAIDVDSFTSCSSTYYVGASESLREPSVTQHLAEVGEKVTTSCDVKVFKNDPKDGFIQVRIKFDSKQS